MEDAAVRVKQEAIEQHHSKRPPNANRNQEPSHPICLIDLSSTDSDSDHSSSSSSDGNDDSVVGVNGKRTRKGSSGAERGISKKKKKKEVSVALPVGFLDPLPPKNASLPPQTAALRPQPALVLNANANVNRNDESCKQFWKAGDYVGESGGDWDTSSGGMDHVRVHPKFLHSNATSHKWVLGAFAELLDNSLDEVCNGATFVNIDMLKSKKDGSRMLLIEDNGGGMGPDKMRQCMSLGYSVKSKIADSIGQYGNGFKTSTMRLGADVIVFSRCCGQDGRRPTQSIGMLSYTFLRSTGKEDIVVPMLDYQGGGREWNKIMRSSTRDWNINVETIVQWSPFSNEAELLRQFNQMKDHGTRVIIYNLWEDDQGQLELDFDADPYDIQIRGVNRDEKKILMAKQFPNSKHFLTYRHSLRSYASILYLRIPPGFRIILRGKDVVHHNVVNDMMMTQEITYRPQPGTDGVPKDSHMVAVVTIGFVKDARFHIDVQGFNVYHKNRLIKPFWRVWNAAGSDGRGVIGVLEANFVEPAHDKQGFERTIVLSRLETKLVQMQKTYWSTLCHKIGYAPRRNQKLIDYRETSPDDLPPSQSKKKKNTGSSSKIPISVSDKLQSHLNQKQGTRGSEIYLKTVDKSHLNGHVYTNGENKTTTSAKSAKGPNSSEPSPPVDVSDDEMQTAPSEKQANGSSQKVLPANKSCGKDDSHISRSSQNLGNTEAEEDCALDGRPVQITTPSQTKQRDGINGNDFSPSNYSNSHALDQLKEENCWLKERLKRREQEILGDLLNDLQNERDKRKSLENKLEEATIKIDELNKEQENLIGIFTEERERRNIEEEKLRKKLEDASNEIERLREKLRLLEKMRSR
ncbi:protein MICRORCHIDIA 7-like [Camellia sinensis]|uniref:protein MICRORCHIDIA 7-like n=1 Tax=Camellia sinensis TaxID=4442 RepID=UPI001036897D|nr:protein MICRORCHIDIA 7-like [Camellia sinensis]